MTTPASVPAPPAPSTWSFVVAADDDRLALDLAATTATPAFLGQTDDPARLAALLASSGADVAIVAFADDERSADAIRAAAATPAAIVATVARLDGQHAIDALSAGATVLVAHPTSARTLAASISAALAGAVVVPGALRRELVRRRPPASLPPLSAEESRLLQLLVLGLDNAEIAATVFASVRTVKRMLHALYAKLGVRGRTEAAVLGVRAEVDPHVG